MYNLKLIFLFSLVVVIIAASLTAAQSGDLRVYDDDLAAPWFHTTNNVTVTLVSTEQVYSGTASMKIVAAPWGWVSMHYGTWGSEGFSPGPYDNVTFEIYPTEIATAVAVFLENDYGDIFPKIPTGPFTANQWNVVTVPMSTLNPGGYTIHRVFIQEFMGSNKTFYVDDMYFDSPAPAAPVLDSPADGSTGISIDPVLSWNASSGAESYHLQVSTSNTFNNLIEDDSTITGTTFTVNGLSQNTTHYWRVNAKNSDGISSWSSVWSFTTAGSTLSQPLLISPTDASTGQPVDITFFWNEVAGAEFYRLQLSTIPTFYFTTYDDSLITGGSKQVSGLTNSTVYYWRVNARNTDTTSAWSLIYSFTTADTGSASNYVLQTEISFPTNSNPSDFSAADYKIVGLPGGGSLQAASVLPGTAGSDWQLYWDNGAAENYITAYNGGPEFVFSLGKAFWVIKNGSWVIDETVPAPPLNHAGQAEIPLHAGWNMITNPFADPVLWYTVQQLNSITDPVYTFTGGGFDESDSLKVFTGYYFFNSTSLQTLRIPSPAYSMNLLKQTNRQTNELIPGVQTNWLINAALHSGDYTDKSLWFGTSSEAKEGFDALDFHKPRGIASLPSVFFYRPYWDENYNTFGSDIRPVSGNIQRWDFDVTIPSGTEAEISFSGIENIPAELGIYLIDDDKSTAVNLRSVQTYRFLDSRGHKSFEVLVGKEEEIKKLLPAQQSKISLGTNYPNPFNLSTVIPFELSGTTPVSIKIYNILGEEMKNVFTGTLDSGNHYVTWDGTNSAGNIVPSGVYFYRLTTEKETQLTRSMVLTK